LKSFDNGAEAVAAAGVVAAAEATRSVSGGSDLILEKLLPPAFQPLLLPGFFHFRKEARATGLLKQ
jgi:hypothetical protein